MLETMQSAVQTTTAEHVWDIWRHAQQGARRFKVPAQEHHGHQACRDDFGIAHLVLRVISMACGFQDVGIQAIHDKDLFIPGGLVFQGEVGRLPSP
jgi:hypothetical protein